MLVKTTDEDAQEHVKKVREAIVQKTERDFSSEEAKNQADFILRLINLCEEHDMPPNFIIEDLKITLKEMSEGTFFENLKAFEKENPYDGQD